MSLRVQKFWWLLLLAALGVACGARDTEPQPAIASGDAETAGTRNPFGLEDVQDCCGPDVQAFARENALPGADDDPNAEPWHGGPGASHDSIDGAWESRWNGNGLEWTRGTATIRTIGDRVYIAYEDAEQYLIEAERQGDRLVGRYVAMYNEIDTSPWVGTIVSNERIDGVWSMGRWDFRRGGGGAP